MYHIVCVALVYPLKTLHLGGKFRIHRKTKKEETIERPGLFYLGKIERRPGICQGFPQVS